MDAQALVTDPRGEARPRARVRKVEVLGRGGNLAALSLGAGEPVRAVEVVGQGAAEDSYVERSAQRRVVPRERRPPALVVLEPRPHQPGDGAGMPAQAPEDEADGAQAFRPKEQGVGVGQGNGHAGGKRPGVEGVVGERPLFAGRENLEQGPMDGFQSLQDEGAGRR
jgi:hypothetical protein